MINDSDEDVIYGSDDESRRPLNASAGKANDYDSDWGKFTAHIEPYTISELRNI